MAVYDCTTEDGREEGVAAAAEAVRDGKIVVLPTDTVYGLGCDAFSGEAVAAVLAAKGRGREMPPPVLVPSERTVDGLAIDIPAWARDLMHEFWPGPLTLVLRAHTSLMWDLGDSNGTVALRMPQDELALLLLTEVGPMAVTSANLSGTPAATTVTEAAAQLGSAVEVYLDDGTRADSLASTIVDCTGALPIVLREGALPREALDQVLQNHFPPEGEEPEEYLDDEVAAADLPAGAPTGNPPDAPTGTPDATDGAAGDQPPGDGP